MLCFAHFVHRLGRELLIFVSHFRRVCLILKHLHTPLLNVFICSNANNLSTLVLCGSSILQTLIPSIDISVLIKIFLFMIVCVSFKPNLCFTLKRIRSLLLATFPPVDELTPRMCLASNSSAFKWMPRLLIISIWVVTFQVVGTITAFQILFISLVLPMVWSCRYLYLFNRF